MCRVARTRAALTNIWARTLARNKAWAEQITRLSDFQVKTVSTGPYAHAQTHTCMHTYAYIHTYGARTRTRARKYTHAKKQTHKHARTHTHTHYTYTCLHTHAHTLGTGKGTTGRSVTTHATTTVPAKNDQWNTLSARGEGSRKRRCRDKW